MSQSTFYEFAGHRLDVAQGVLFSRSVEVRLQPKTCELLRIFLSHAQEYLTIDYLLEEVWRDDTSETNEGVLDFQISILRQKLKDNHRPYRMIETRRKNGPILKAYRFTQPVNRTGPAGLAAEHYEKARHFYHKSSGPDIQKAITYYKKVIDLQGDYLADAYAGIAEAFVLLGSFGHQTIPTSDAMRQAKDAAMKALALDPHVAEAHNALACVAALHDWNWDAAVQHFGDALSMPANPLIKPVIRAWYALSLAARGDHAKAREQIDMAKSDHPTSFTVTALSGRIAYLARNIQLAIAECDESIALEEHFYLSYVFKGHALRHVRQFDQAMACFTKASELTSNHPVCLAEVASVHALQGRRDQSYGIIEQLGKIRGQQFVSSHLFASVFIGLGEIENAINMLFDVYGAREPYLIFLQTEPLYDPLRAHWRFSELVRLVGFP